MEEEEGEEGRVEMEEKEKKEGKRGACLGGVLLSDNDKSLLERWKRMSDSRVDKHQSPESNGTKISDSRVSCCHSQSAASKTIQKSNMEAAEPQPTKQHIELPIFKPSSQLVPPVGQCVPSGMFQLPAAQTVLPFALGKPQDSDMGLVALGGGGGLSVVGAGGLGVVGAACPLPKNNLLKVPPQPSSRFVGTSVFNSLESWTGTPAGMATPQQLPQQQHPPPQPQIPSQPQQIRQPPQVSPLAPQKNFSQSLPHTQPQAHLQTPLNAFVNPNPGGTHTDAEQLQLLFDLAAAERAVTFMCLFDMEVWSKGIRTSRSNLQRRRHVFTEIHTHIAPLMGLILLSCYR